MREIGSLQVHTRYLTFSLKKNCPLVLKTTSARTKHTDIITISKHWVVHNHISHSATLSLSPTSMRVDQGR